MSLSLYRKYRPQKFSDAIGQEHIIQTLANSIKNNRIGHAYLFSGPRGTGKTTFARIFARAINCINNKDGNPCLECEMCKNITNGQALDIIEIDAASNTGVDNIRELRENAKFSPLSAKFKVYIIDEVHMLSTGAFNALLKILEEPPAYIIFILATTEIHKVPETIISRCQRFDFTRLSISNIIKKLSSITKNEDIKIEKDALEMIAIAAEGAMRDAESILSQIISTGNKNITTKEIEEMFGTAKRKSLEEMAEFLIQEKTNEAILLINKISENGYDLEIFNKSFLNFLRQLLIISVDKKLTEIFSSELTGQQIENLDKISSLTNTKDVLHILECFNDIQGKIKSAFIPQLPLEMAIIKSTKKVVLSELKSIDLGPISPVSLKNTSNLKEDIKSNNQAPQKAENNQNIASKKDNIENLDFKSFSINDVKKHWNQVLLDIKNINHSLSAILQNCQIYSTQDSTIKIVTNFSFHKEKLNEIQNKLTMESVFAKILKSKVKIDILTSKEAGVTVASSLVSSKTDNVEQKQSITSSLLSDAVNIMGGQIIE